MAKAKKSESTAKSGRKSTKKSSGGVSAFDPAALVDTAGAAKLAATMLLNRQQLQAAKASGGGGLLRQIRQSSLPGGVIPTATQSPKGSPIVTHPSTQQTQHQTVTRDTRNVPRRTNG